MERTAHAVGKRAEAWQQRQGALAVLARAARDESEELSDQTLYVSFDGTGVPMRRRELEGRKGKSEDGKARTREVKLGCVFTQTPLDSDGHPVRDEGATTYTGAIENSTDFGYRIRAEALRRGMGQAARTAVITDGAAYNHTIVREHFAHATHIIDLYHARQHLAEFARDAALVGLESPWHEEARRLLGEGRIEELAAHMRGRLARSGKRRTLGLKQIAYFRTNAESMRYGRFRAEGLFIGSGVIEAGCRTLVAQRLKNSGMFWTLDGANAIIALRCIIQSNRFEQFWENAA